MSVHASFEAFKKIEWWEFVIRFVGGGLITVLAGLVAHAWGPLVGGLFLAFPSIAPAAATLVDRHDGRDAAVADSYGASAGAAGLLAFGAIVAVLAPRLSMALVLAIACAVSIGVSVLVWWVATTLYERPSGARDLSSQS